MELHKHPSISQLHVYTEEAGNTILKLHLQVRVMAGAHPTISSLASTGWQNCSKHRATHQSESFLLHLLTSKLISIGGKYINIHTHTRIHTHTYIYVFMCYIHIPVYIHTHIKIKGCNTKSRYFFFLTTKWRKTPKYSNESKDMLLLKLAQLHVGAADL